MSKTLIPKDYKPALSLHDTQIAIKDVKDIFQSLLTERLNLLRVSAPLFVDPKQGLNDNLNGVERPVAFGIKEQDEYTAEIVHSLAKWKRYALKKYGFKVGEGLYTDMNAIRRDEDTDNIHSIFVDQWDWEEIITKEDYYRMRNVSDRLCKEYGLSVIRRPKERGRTSLSWQDNYRANFRQHWYRPGHCWYRQRLSCGNRDE